MDPREFARVDIVWSAMVSLFVVCAVDVHAWLHTCACYVRLPGSNSLPHVTWLGPHLIHICMHGIIGYRFWSSFFFSFCFFLGHLFRSDLQMHLVPQRWCKHRLFVHYMCALFVSCAMRWASVRGLVSLSFFVRSYARPLARYGVHALLQFLFRAGHPLACNGTHSTGRTTRSHMLLTYLALILASCRPHV